MAARSKARKRALDVLFEAELRGLPVLELLAERMSLGDRPTPEYAAEVVRGVAAHSAEIDKLIADNAVDWTLERMPAVDRNILRIGVWELRWADDVPTGVAISEAVELAQDLSTDGSPAFVNGLLAKVATLDPAALDAEPLAEAKSPSDLGPGRGEGLASRPARSAGLINPRISAVLRPVSAPPDDDWGDSGDADDEDPED